MATRGFWAGVLWGAGLALFLVYVLTDEAAIGLTLTRPQRLAVGGLGLAMWAAGFALGSRLRGSGRPAGAESVAAKDRARKAGPGL